MGSSDKKDKKKHKKEKKSKKSKRSATPERRDKSDKKRKVDREDERSESEEDRRKGSEEPRKGGEDEEAPVAKTNNEVSMSVEETNKLREKLGLKPLDNKKTSTNEVHAPPKNMGRMLETEHLVEKMKVMKEKRKIKQELNRVRSLGSTTSTHEFTDTLAWVNKNRNIEAKKVLAASQTKMLDAMDDEFGIGDLVETSTLFNKKREYTSKDLENLTVDHNMEHFKEGDMTILTLQDKGILDEDQDDVLENVNMVDSDKLAKNLELLKKKPDYNPYDEEFDEHGKLKTQNMLSKYNEVIEGEKRKQFRINNSTNSVDMIKRKMAAGLAPAKNVPINLEFSHVKKVASEYFSTEEIASFKKPKSKKKRKIRKTTVDDILPLPSDARMGSKESGSRSSRGRKGAEVVKDQSDNMEIDIEEAPVKKRAGGVIDDEELFSVRADDDDSDLQAALSRSRRLAVKKMQPSLQDRLNAIPLPSDDLPGTTKSAQIVLDTTAEFAKGVGALDAASVIKAEEEVQKEMEVEEAEEEKNTEAWNEVDFVTAQYGEFQDYTPQKTEAMEAEPLLQRGLCGALAMASRKGFIDESKKGRSGRDIGDSIAATGLLKAKFFQIDRDTGQDVDARRRDRDYGSSSFPEKKSYNPDVKIVYTDGAGRELNSKEAFRQLSHKFHGKGSGKMKTEKRMKKVLEQLALKKMDSDDTPLGSASLLREKTKEANSTYIVLSGGNRANQDANTNISKNPSKSSKR